jgi:hypothetical protein
VAPSGRGGATDLPARRQIRIPPPNPITSVPIARATAAAKVTPQS